MALIKGVWKYVGPGPGKGLDHLVVDSNLSTVTTWSEPVNCAEDLSRSSAAGYSWHGKVADFLMCFKRLA